MKLRLLPGWRLVLTLVSSSVMIVAATAAEPLSSSPAPAATGLIKFSTPQGVNYAALVLPAPTPPQLPATPHDHVVIVDTSASQNGDFRTRSIAVAAEVCRQLPAGDRVRLIASDVAAEDLTNDFVAVRSPELQAGFDRLEERVPLGSSSLELALRTAAGKFTGDHARSILYIGDGFSTAQLIHTKSLRKLVAELREAAVPVSSFAIGPRTDLVMLGALAQHTGGVVVIDEPDEVADQTARPGELASIGKQLAKAAVAPVLYPDSLKATPEIPSLMPQVLPPVRFDRETVLLGKNFAGDKVQLTVTGTIQGQKRDLAWTIGQEQVEGSTGFVAQAWTVAETTQGMAMPWAGRDMLIRGHKIFQSQLESLVAAGEQSLKKKDVRQVDQIIKTLHELDPNSTDAAQLQQFAQQLKPKKVSRQRVLAQAEGQPAEEPPAATEPAAPIPGDLDQDTSDPKAGSLLDELETKRKVREEQLTNDVSLALETANQGARDSYLDAQDVLKRQLDAIIAATDISADVRRALQKRVENSIQKLQNENELFEQQRAGLDRKLSQEEAKKKLMEQAWRDEEKMQQLIDRVRALMVRGYKGNPQAFEDAEAVSRVAVELDPYNGVPNLDVFNTEAAGALDKARRLRSERADRLLATLHQVELSHVPFPDEPPILWPSPERWQWITENRRKWKSVDLKSYSKKEEKIVQELDKPTTFDFTDESLDGVRESIMERHGFDIVIDKAKLEEESVTTDATDITLKVNEITLKNALKLLLDTKNLTYVIENEVMKITTKTEGIGKRPLRVYNVGDLVMPINPLFGMGGGGMGGGMMGGMGGGMMGGMGGGMGGGGMFGGGGMGMGGGMGGMGMGGGMFNVPPTKDNKNGQAKPAAVPGAKQPAAPAGKKVTSVNGTGQAFAQVQDREIPKLSGSTVKDRKKKAPVAR